MHTLLVITGGLALLVAGLLAAPPLGGTPAGAGRLFLPAWLALSLINAGIGVARAGYPPADELAILLPVFGIPAAAALLAIRYCAKA